MFPVPTIVISLKRAQNRRKNAERELLDQGADWEILDAIDGLKLQNTPPEYNEKKVSRLLGFPLTLSEIGCFLSHREAWLNCIEKDQTVLILEDDFVLSPRIKQAISYLIENQACWDVARLQGLAQTNHTVITVSDAFEIVTNKDDPLGATAYLLKPYAAKKLLVESHEIYEPLDHFLEHNKKHGLRMVAIKPYPVSTNGSESTIFDRPDRKSISGSRKMMRSICRAFDRIFNPYPWFPK